MFGEEEIIRSHKRRAGIIANLVLISFAIVISRLWYLQVYKGSLLYTYSLQNRLRRENVKAPRGMIFSRNNKMLVNNIPRLDAILTPQYLKDKKKTLSRLSKILDQDVKSILGILKKNSGQARYRPIVIKKNISRREVAQIETDNNKVPGVSVDAFISREYLDKEIGSHVLGYISEITKAQLPKLRKKNIHGYKLGNFIGQAGLEERFDETLRGEDGHVFVEVDALGRRKRRINIDNFFKGIKNKPSIPGKNIRLTIDRDLQISGYNALKEKVGAVVALDVNTGEVLAMVSRPGYDPSKFSRGLTQDYWGKLVQDPRKPLRNKTVQDHYPPGSTYKPLMALAGLEEGAIDHNTEVKCTGSFRFGRRPFHCWKKYGHGRVDVIKAIRESCDVFFYKLASKVDIDDLSKYAKLFGLGDRSGIDLSREQTGLIPTREWKRRVKKAEWFRGETLSCVIGQSYVLSTPLQLAISYSALANGGKIYKPYLVKEIFDNSGSVIKKFDPILLRENNLDPRNIALVNEGLHQVANNPRGTAWYRRGKGIDMSGKTGTSQVLRFSSDKIYAKCEELEYKYRHHGLFVAFAPRDNPKIVASAIIEHGCSSSKAVPIVEAVITTYMKKYHPAQYEILVKKDLRMYKKIRDAREKAKKEKEDEKEST